MKGVALAAAFVVAMSQPVFGAVCEKRNALVKRLEGKYSEVYTAGGLQGTQQVQTMVEVWASASTGTFTVILTNPLGVS